MRSRSRDAEFQPGFRGIRTLRLVSTFANEATDRSYYLLLIVAREPSAGNDRQH